MKLWLFGTYAWQGNPKALFLYMTKFCQDTHECWWVADNEKDAESIKKTTDLQQITFSGSKKAAELFARCDVYVNENFREAYPAELPETAKIFNTWHGVGLKHIELALIGLGIGLNHSFIESVMRKNIKNFSRYHNQTLFLVTSDKMEQHFVQETTINPDYVVRGNYPRNIAYKSRALRTFELNDVLPKHQTEYKNILAFVPTHRFGSINGVLYQLLPDFSALETALIESNQLLIVKVHPMMKNDPYCAEMAKKYANSQHILFWDDKYDIYEVFSDINAAIVDYSSIFYDMLDAGVNKFIRYIPDLEQYQENLELIGDYMDLTEGVVVESFSGLLTALSSDLPPISNERKAYLNDYFFGYAEHDDAALSDSIASVANIAALDKLIALVDDYQLQPRPLKELHSFDVFDTLIRRSTLKPLSIFDYMREKIRQADIDFPVFLIEDWTTIRNKVEHDVRDIMRKTTFERQSNKLEITLDQIYARLQDNMRLSDAQIVFLKNCEIEAEVAHVEPIQKRIDLLFALKEAGHDVVLASDMYLPEAVIRRMIEHADSRLRGIPLYLSGNIGYQKASGKLYQYIFSNIGYQYSRWVHYGDNKHADGSVPRRLGIETMVHDMDAFIPFENALVNAMDNINRYPAYQLATKMHRYRTALLPTMDSKLLEQRYYAYAYAGSAFVPYVNWVIQDALSRNYETLYFVSRDGHFLKQIADRIITKRGLALKTKYIYGSRKVWRLPSFIDKVDEETFWQFGNFVSMDCFDDLVKASYLSEDELLAMFPEFSVLKDAKHLRGHIAEHIRKVLGGSQVYRERVLQIAAEKRGTVRRYLQQEIDPNEKFAFVEFWARGYTQDVFGRLLNDAFGREITNPFYYARSFTDNIGTSVRHNFISTAQNLAFLEPIFAQTPYESIAAYRENGDKIEAVITPTDSTMSDIISQGLADFIDDYLALDTVDAQYFNHALSQFTYQYQLTTPNDQFICNTFAELKYNASSFGEVKAYAPALSLKDLQHVGSKQELDKLTMSLPISLAKSDAKAVEYYQKIQKSYKLPAVKVLPLEQSFVTSPLQRYVYSNSFPFEVIALQDNSIYLDVAFNGSTKRKDMYLQKFHTIEVIAIDWLKNGVPRLLTPYGYITANKEWIQKFDDVAQNFTEREDGEGYDWTPDISTQALFKSAAAHLGLVPQPAPAANKKTAKNKPTLISSSQQQKRADQTVFQRKLYKFARDPYTFFKDSKSKGVSWLKVLFNEKHALGRKMSRFVRDRFN